MFKTIIWFGKRLYVWWKSRTSLNYNEIIWYWNLNFKNFFGLIEYCYLMLNIEFTFRQLFHLSALCSVSKQKEGGKKNPIPLISVPASLMLRSLIVTVDQYTENVVKLIGVKPIQFLRFIFFQKRFIFFQKRNTNCERYQWRAEGDNIILKDKAIADY